MSLMRVCMLAVLFVVPVAASSASSESSESKSYLDIWLPIGTTLKKWFDQNGMPEEVYRDALSCVKEYKSNEIKAQGREVTQEMLDKMNIRVGGVILSLDQCKELLAQQQAPAGRKKRDILPFSKLPEMKWLMPIKYRLDGTHNADDLQMILAAMKHWEEDTCIRFEETGYPKEQHLIFTSQDEGCFAYVGSVPKDNSFPQQLNLQTNKCTHTLGIGVHEIGHSLGMWHEHASPKSKGRVKVDWENIGSLDLDQFTMQKASVTDDKNVGYDPGSLMHYGPKRFAIDHSKFTLETADKLYQRTIGQSGGLSFFDRKLVNLAYCAKQMDECPPRECKNRGYQDPNNCNRCLCPEGYGGDYCELPAPQISDCQPSNPVIELNSADEVCIRSDNYGNGPYQNGGSCNWHVSAPFGCKINMRFRNEFGVYCEQDKPTCQHWVEIKYRGDLALTGPRFCCYDTPLFNGESFLASESNKAVVLFNSMYPLVSNAYSYVPNTSERTGFKLCFAVDNADCLPTPLPPGCEPFGPWSDCSRSCGGCGRKRSSRACIDPETGFKRIDTRFQACKFDKCEEGAKLPYRFKKSKQNKIKIVSKLRHTACCVDYTQHPFKPTSPKFCKRVNGIRVDGSTEPINAGDLSFDPQNFG